jgi:hypothetical protein
MQGRKLRNNERMKEGWKKEKRNGERKAETEK